jgi:hypothetical protein
MDRPNSNWKVIKLKEELTKLKCPIYGNKVELIKRLNKKLAELEQKNEEEEENSGNGQEGERLQLEESIDTCNDIIQQENNQHENTVQLF